MKELFEIFIASAKVGALTFGGGYAMLPILQREIVENKGWNSEAEILDYYALAQCLPGILMVNTLAFVGKNRKGNIGAVFAALESGRSFLSYNHHYCDGAHGICRCSRGQKCFCGDQGLRVRADF